MGLARKVVLQHVATCKMKFIVSTGTGVIVLGDLYSGGTCFKKDNPRKTKFIRKINGFFFFFFTKESLTFFKEHVFLSILKYFTRDQELICAGFGRQKKGMLKGAASLNI